MGETIEIVRGTTNSFEIALKDETGAFYTMQPDEIMRFGVKDRVSFVGCKLVNTKYILVKEITYENINSKGNAYVLTLRPEDTENMEFRGYSYDIGLQSGTDYFNVVPCSDFKLCQNITSREG